jgi:hypothetical protein
MAETPWGRYLRRQGEVALLKKQTIDNAQEVKEELEAAQKECNPHVDDGGMFFGNCVKCGKDLG